MGGFAVIITKKKNVFYGFRKLGICNGVTCSNKNGIWWSVPYFKSNAIKMAYTLYGVFLKLLFISVTHYL